ncbi:MAG: sulfatase-like hydrolase/transferase, partial [Rhodospirillaceae bacterium]|nr:sulfatase-like hydrolase/transferase [Rhodospirillaceae bacterium]
MATDKPNILFIMADQMSARALRHYGNRTTLTPNIDRLADEGVVFENCYCNLPMCAPSRASMMAGILPFAIDMYDNASEFHADIPT